MDNSTYGMTRNEELEILKVKFKAVTKENGNLVSENKFLKSRVIKAEALLKPTQESLNRLTAEKSK